MEWLLFALVLAAIFIFASRKETTKSKTASETLPLVVTTPKHQPALPTTSLVATPSAAMRRTKSQVQRKTRPSLLPIVFVEGLGAEAYHEKWSGSPLRVSLEYVDASGVVTERDVEARYLLKSRWPDQAYIVGHCLLRNELRSFRLDRILRLRVRKREASGEEAIWTLLTTPKGKGLHT